MSADQTGLNSIQSSLEASRPRVADGPFQFDPANPDVLPVKRTELTQLNNQRDSVRSNDDSQRSRQQEQLQSVGNDISTIGSQLAGANTRLNSARQNVQNATSAVANQRNVTSSARANMDNLYNQYTSALAENPEDANTSRLEVLFRSAENRFHDEEGRLQQAEGQLSEARDGFQTARGEVSNLTSQLSNRNSQRSSLSSQVSSAPSGGAPTGGSALSSSSPSGGSPSGGSPSGGNVSVNGLKSPSQTASEIEGFLKSMSGGAGRSTGSGNGFLDGARTILRAIQGVYQRGISTNAFVNKSKHYTVKTLAQAGKAMAEAGMAQQVTSTSQVAFALRTTLARLQGFSGLAQEGQQYWNDIAKTNFAKGVGNGSDQITA